MTDQLSLRLDPALPQPPATLRPMLARPLGEPFDSAEHLFEPDWGGVRALAFVDPDPSGAQGAGEVRMVGEDGAWLAVPVDLGGLAARIAARSAVLDGEIVAVDGAGRLDAEALVERLAGRPGRPLSYLAFDLLDLDGRSLLRLPLERRRAQLRRVLRPGDEVVAVPAIEAEGRALYDAAGAQGLAAIRARHRASPYLPGVRSRLWRRIAVGATAAPGDRATADFPPAPGHAGAVLAVFRRLPLPIEDDAPAG
jgi:bifunctional non-homologous end joining protein LigD